MAGLLTIRRVKLVSHGLTDVGRKRAHNEDNLLVAPDLGLFVVADGMGGHAHGERASRIAIEAIEKFVREAHGKANGAFHSAAPLEESPLADTIRIAVEVACAAVYHEALREPSLSGMGTTVTAMLFHDRGALFGHVGDSRAYVCRGGKILQVSEDHSLVNEQVKAGMLTPEQAKSSRLKNIITRSVGFEEDVLVDVMGVPSIPGDTFVLCSDGLANMVQDQEILDAVRTTLIPELPGKLIALANERGGDDNITVIAVRHEAG